MIAAWAGYSFSRKSSSGAYSPSAEAAASQPSGSFRATGGKLGTWEMPVTGCRSGEKYGFSGVMLFDKADKSRHIRVIQNGRGKPQIFVQLEGHDPVEITCKTANVKIEQTGTSLNFHDELRGSVELACPNLSGGATFPSCA
jgi:hypothetical protein